MLTYANVSALACEVLQRGSWRRNPPLKKKKTPFKIKWGGDCCVGVGVGLRGAVSAARGGALTAQKKKIGAVRSARGGRRVCAARGGATHATER